MQLTDAEWSALIAYAHEEAAPEEVALVRSLLVTNAGAALVLQELSTLRASYAAAGNNVNRFDARAALEAMQDRLDKDQPDGVGSNKPGTSARKNSARHGVRETERLGTQTLRRWGLSLGVVATLVATFFVVHLGPSPTPGITRSYTTGVDQQGIVTLDDGTRVTLAPQTTLRLIGFSTHQRTVSVDGRAHFEVTHAAGAPFEVRSGAITTRALGTAFLVEHTSRSARVRVAVEEGKVRVSSTLRPTEGAIVAAGYVSEITDSVTTTSAVVDSTFETQWLHGKLVFYNAPVAVVLQTLSRWYGYQFRYADSTLSRRDVTIGVSVRSSAAALATLEHILKVNLTVAGDTVTLTPQVAGRVKGMPRVRSYDVWTPTERSDGEQTMAVAPE